MPKLVKSPPPKHALLSTRQLTVLENERAQEIRGQTIEKQPFLTIMQNCFTGMYVYHLTTDPLIKTVHMLHHLLSSG